ncbi:MAG TPA: c-type cytochrome [Opitutaceae bacterium]|nr:c-type cytochrome [Opitutaceae bacterium]
MNHHTRLCLLALIGLALPASLAFAAEAKDNWAENCSRCHGADGSGQTKIGKKLGVKDYTSADVQAKMTDDDMLKTILQGATIDGKQKMPAYAEKLSADDAKALVGYIRSFKK